MKEGTHQESRAMEFGDKGLFCNYMGSVDVKLMFFYLILMVYRHF